MPRDGRQPPKIRKLVPLGLGLTSQIGSRGEVGSRSRGWKLVVGAGAVQDALLLLPHPLRLTGAKRHQSNGN